MKKIFALISAVTISHSFSFMKMEGPFGVKPKPISEFFANPKPNFIKLIETDENLFEEIETKIKTKYEYLIFYNSQTGYMITISMNVYDNPFFDISKNLKIDYLISQFFQGNKVQDDLLDSNFFIVKEEKNLKITDFTFEDWNKTNIEMYHNEVLFLLNCYSDENLYGRITKKDISQIKTENHIVDFKLQPIINISDVTIHNQNNQVTININQNKPMNFQNFLHNYYNDEKYKDVLRDTIVDLKRSSKTDATLEKEMKHNTIEISSIAKTTKENKPSYDLLKKSTILRVDAVLKGEKEENSIICGLAKDNDTKEPFFWIADLKKDISTLLNQK